MLNLRLARFDHLVDIGRVAELPTRRAAQRRLVVGAGVRDRVHRARPDRRRGGAAAAPRSTPVHRPLPDPQPGHDRRLARPRRPGRRVPGGGAGARRRRSTSRRPGGTRTVPAAEFFTGVLVDGARGRRAAARDLLPGVGRALRLRRRRVRPPPRRLRHRRRRRGRRSSTTPAPIARSALAVVRRRRRRPSPAPPPSGAGRDGASPTSTPPSWPSAPWPTLDDVTDDPQVPAAYRRRVAAAVVADAWRRAVDDLEGSDR